MTHAESQQLARLIVCEHGSRWAMVLRHELAGVGVRVWETRTPTDCWNELAESPASFVVIELRRHVDRLLDYLARQQREFPLARLAVVAERSLADYEWLAREAGAACFLASPRQVGALAQLACRHLAQAPVPQQSLTERIWSGLPWGGRKYD